MTNNTNTTTSSHNNNQWKQAALVLHKQGVSWRKIAKLLNKPKSSVSDFLRLEVKGYVKPTELSEAKKGDPEKKKNIFKDTEARVLYLDIESSPLLSATWSLWNNNIGLNQIHNDWYMLSYCAKWADSDEIFYEDIRDTVLEEDDHSILGSLWNLLDEADIVIGHNARKFDVKKINARLILQGFSKPSSYRVVDTLEIAKEVFGFPSNRLQYLTDKLCLENKKTKSVKFHGYELWKECLKGNPEAFDEMREYNLMDVLSLEELTIKIAPWSNRIPNLDVFSPEPMSNEDWTHVGYHYSNMGKYDKFQNDNTGQYRRGRVNLLTKEKRASLLSNVV